MSAKPRLGRGVHHPIRDHHPGEGEAKNPEGDGYPGAAFPKLHLHARLNSVSSLEAKVPMEVAEYLAGLVANLRMSLT